MQNDYLARVYAGFLGMNVGIRLGAPVEPTIWTYERIKETYGDIRGYVKDYKNFAADDDVNGPVYFFRALRDSSKNGELTPEYVAKAWLNYARDGIGMFWWGGYGVSTEHTAYINLTRGIPAPQSGSAATNCKLLSDQIGGQIFIDGQDITRLRGRDLIPVYAKIQMVFQSPVDSFDPRRTLGDGICESLRNKGVPKAEREAKARALLESCGLPATFLARYPHQVSGGQCQRAAIARALMNDPRILIFDEATSALDVTVQKQIIELLQQLQKERKLAYLFICHNIALVQQFCDRVIVLHDGRIVESGLPDKVILHPQSDYTRRLVDAVF